MNISDLLRLTFPSESYAVFSNLVHRIFNCTLLLITGENTCNIAKWRLNEGYVADNYSRTSFLSSQVNFSLLSHVRHFSVLYTILTNRRKFLFHKELLQKE